MSIGEEICLRVWLGDELTNWIELLNQADDEWATTILTRIVLLTLRTEYNDIGDFDQFLRKLKELRLQIMENDE